MYMIVILLISLKKESGGGGFFSCQEDNRIHVYRNIVNSDQEEFLICKKKMYVLEEILGRISASFPDDRGRFTCTCMHMNTSIQINNECAYFTIMESFEGW